MQTSYSEFIKSQPKRETTSNETGKKWEKNQTKYFALKNSGDTAIVRFPYKSPDDLMITTCHLIKKDKKDIFGRKVECNKDKNIECPLCKSGKPLVNRLFLKFIAYTTDSTGKVILTPTVWERSESFAGILVGKMENYGDLSNHLFKIRRNGTGQDTTYDIDVILNKEIYPEDKYVKDFSTIERLDASKMFVMKLEKYQAQNELEATYAKSQVEFEKTPFDKNTESTKVSTEPSTTSSEKIPSESEAIARPKRYTNF